MLEITSFGPQLAHFLLISTDVLGRVGKYGSIDLEFPCETTTGENPDGM